MPKVQLFQLASILFRAGAAALGVGATTLFFTTILPVNAITVGFFYLLLILTLATLWGFREAAVASVLSMLTYNFFFLPPLGQFTIADPENWVALFTFLVTALVASHLSDRAKKQAMEAKRRQRETEQLYALSRAILLTDAAQPIGAQAAQQIAQIFAASSVVLFDPQNGTLCRGGPNDIPGIESSLKQVALQGAPSHDASTNVEFWPIALGGRSIGALAIQGIRLSDSATQALLNLVAIAIERLRTGEAANRAEAARQSEEFKSTLLDAVAHEFKTPLTSIKAASTTLLGDESAFRADHRELLTIIDEETDRMNLLVTEAVKMSQIDAGKVKFERTAVDVSVVVRGALLGFSGRGEDRIEILAPHAGLPRLFVDAEMVSLALKQVIDNGLKYSTPGSPIRITARQEGDRIVIRIVDQGPGIPERDRERIFEKFFRRSSSRDKVPGSGLGLHIAREIIRAQNGDVWVEAGAKSGSEFCIALPRFTREASSNE